MLAEIGHGVEVEVEGVTCEEVFAGELVWLTQQDRGGDHDSGSYRARFWARQRPTRASLAAVGQV
jgi:hypothetical protein